MAAPLSQSVRDAMRARAQQVKDSLARGSGAFTRMWQLTGKNAIVTQGEEVVIRLLPRWDRYVVKDGKVVADPAALDKEIYIEASEHWWDGSGGQRRREWCPGQSGEPCPICEAVEELRASANADDRVLAKDLRASSVVLFNAMVGPIGERLFTEEGKPDIRPIAVPGTIFLAISDIMTGGDQESFARGDVSDPAEGYDLKLARPAGKGDRWKVDVAPQMSRLFAPSEAARWQGWWRLIVDLDDLLSKETKSWEALFEAYHEVKPEEAAPDPAKAGASAGAPAGGRGASAPRAAAPAPAPADDMLDLGLEGLDDLPGGAGGASAPPATSPPAARPPRGAPPRGRSGRPGR